jgi:hypothetical protein
MKLSDIMRDIADLLDQQVDDQQGGATNTHLKPVQAPEPELSDEPLMVPPLQAKLEILKKSEGMPNVYDGEGSSDEIALMKKRAGISTAQHEASEDNDVLG